MNFLISLLLTVLFIFIGRNFIKKNSKLCYIIALTISLILVIASFTGVLSNLSPFVNNYVLAIFTKSSFATALFVVVMYTGALKNGSKLMKILMPIRAELSIIASILTLSHNIIYGRTHFVMLFTNPKSMSLNMLLAAIMSIIMIVIMVPLMITSFPSIRKKMKYKSWKNLQRFAYGFYGLIYVHIMLIMMPIAKLGHAQYIVNILVYSLVFLIYAVLRINKAVKRKTSNNTITIISSFIALIIFIFNCFYIFSSDTNKSDLNNSNNNIDPSIAKEDESILKDGSYEGTGSGFNGNISVEVTIENNEITAISVTDTVDDGPFVTKASGSIFANVISSQSTDVDTVSGATYSSNGLIEAINNALDSSKN